LTILVKVGSRANLHFVRRDGRNRIKVTVSIIGFIDKI
jgi:hypothetical protein